MWKLGRAKTLKHFMVFFGGGMISGCLYELEMRRSFGETKLQSFDLVEGCFNPNPVTELLQTKENAIHDDSGNYTL